MELEKKMEGVAKAFESFKEINEKRLKEIEEKGFALSETQAQLEKANKEIDRLNTEVKQVAALANRNGAGEQKAQENAEAKNAFTKWMRKGNISEVEEKALSVQSDPDGGYLVLPEMSDEIVKKVFESSPVRQLASVATISSDSLEIIEDLDEAAAAWVTEVGSRAETSTPQLKKIVIAVHEMYAKPKASQKILDDAMLNVESWLQEKVADKFARTEASAFVNGDGVNKPRGLLTYTAGTSFGQIEQINSGSAAAITADGLIDLAYSLKGFYKAGASFMMKRATIGSVRQLKDLQGQYLWQPALTAGSPDMLLGHALYEADDMPAEGANALAVLFGNFKMGYQIVDRFGIRVLRDPFSSKPYVEFYTTKRVGGDVKNFEAIKILKCAV